MGKCLLGDKQPTCISLSLSLQSNLHYGNKPTNKIQHHLLGKKRDHFLWKISNDLPNLSFNSQYTWTKEEYSSNPVA